MKVEEDIEGACAMLVPRFFQGGSEASVGWLRAPDPIVP